MLENLGEAYKKKERIKGLKAAESLLRFCFSVFYRWARISL